MFFGMKYIFHMNNHTSTIGNTITIFQNIVPYLNPVVTIILIVEYSLGIAEMTESLST